MILSATGIIASLIASQALKGPHSSVLAVVALAATVVGVLLCVFVLWPAHDHGSLPGHGEPLPVWNRWPSPRERRRREWQVTVPPKATRELRGAGAITNQLLDELQQARQANYTTLERRSTVFGWACVMLGVQLVLWTLVLEIPH